MGLMIDAYKTAAQSFIEQVEPNEKAYKRVLTERAAVVQSCYDIQYNYKNHLPKLRHYVIKRAFSSIVA